MRRPILGIQAPSETELAEPQSSRDSGISSHNSGQEGASTTRLEHTPADEAALPPPDQPLQAREKPAGGATTRLVSTSETESDELPLGIPRSSAPSPKTSRRNKTDDKADALGLSPRSAVQGQSNANQRRTKNLWTLALILVMANALIVAGACAWFYNVFAAEIENRLSDGLTRLANTPAPISEPTPSPPTETTTPKAVPVDLEGWKKPVEEMKAELQAEIQTGIQAANKAADAKVAQIQSVQSQLQTELKAAQERADAAEERLKAYEEQSKAVVTRLRDVAAAAQSEDRIKPAVVAAETVPGGQQLTDKLLPTQSELVLLKERNRLTSLADESIATGAREPYEQLWKAVNDPRMVNLIHGARAEILRVQQFYLSGSRLPKYEIPVADVFPDTPNLRDAQLSDDQLITLLSSPKQIWQNRVKAAWLLGQRKSEKAAEALVKAVKEDKNLDVVKEATFSFEQMTGYRASIFEAKALEAWWKEFNAVPQVKKPAQSPIAAKGSAAKGDDKPASKDSKNAKPSKP